MQSSQMGAELARLRRRAYGPDADISGDPDAVARLAQLEVALRGESDAEADPVAELAHDAPTGQAETSPGHRAGASGTAATATSGRVIRSATRWRLLAIVLVVAIAAALLGAAVAVGIAGLTADRPDLELRATEVDPATDPALDATLLASFRVPRDSLRGFEDYRGYRAWAGATDDGLSCLFVTNSDRGLVAQSCTVPSIDPIADFQIGNGTISLGGGPRGVVRFELHGAVVDVYDRHVAAQEPTP